MKKSLFLAVLFLSSVAFGAEIQGGRFNAKTDSIELEVRYGGGCKDHDFYLDLGNYCLESYPVQCPDVQLFDRTKGDTCEALVHKTVSISLESAGLTDSYFNGARLTIRGDAGTSVKIDLPFRK